MTDNTDSSERRGTKRLFGRIPVDEADFLGTPYQRDKVAAAIMAPVFIPAILLSFIVVEGGAYVLGRLRNAIRG